MQEAIAVDQEVSLNPYRGKGFTVETKFMKQYRQASPVDHGRQGVAVRNKDGQIELFTIGTDGTVWNFYPDSSSSTGYRKATVGDSSNAGILKGDLIAAGVDHGGSVVVLAASGIEVKYAVKHYDGKGKWGWSRVMRATFPMAGGAEKGGVYLAQVKGIYARTVDSQLYVAVGGRGVAGDPKHDFHYHATSQWNITAGSFLSYSYGAFAPLPGRGMASFWTHAEGYPAPVFSALMEGPHDPKVSYFGANDVVGSRVKGPTNPNWPSSVVSTKDLSNVRSATVDIDSPPDKVGRNKIFLVDKDGNLNQLVRPKVEAILQVNKITYEMEPLSSNLNLIKVHAVHDNDGGTHLLCLSKDNCLYHFAPMKDSPTGYRPLSREQRIRENVAWVAIARNNQGNIELYWARNQTGGQLLRMTLNQHTGDWDGDVKVEVPETGNAAKTVEEFISYSSEISVTDKAGAPLPNASATITASDRTAITVNGATYSIDISTPAHIRTNSAAKLSITQQTTNLGVPDLWIEVEGVTSAGEGLFLAQYGNGREGVGSGAPLPKEMLSIEARLKGLQDSDLAAAKDASGKPLLKASIRDSSDQCKQLVKALHNCMNLRSAQPLAAAPLHRLISREGTSTGLHVEPQAAALERSRVIAHAGLPSWSLSFDEAGVSYQTLTPEKANTILAEMRSNSLVPGGLIAWETDRDDFRVADGISWWSTIGDFLESVVEGFFGTVIEIAKILVDGVKVAVQFTINKVKYVLDAVIGFVQQSFDLVETILTTVYESVVNFFEKTFEWLGFLLDWNHILLTQKALAYTIEQGLGFLPLAIADIRSLAHAGLGNLRKAADNAFDELRRQVGGVATLGGYGEANKQSDPKFVFSGANNFVLNGVIENVGAAGVQAGVSSSTMDTPALNTFMDQLQRFANDAQGKPEFRNMQGYMETVGRSADNIFTAVFSTLLDLAQNLVNALIVGVQALIDAALDAIEGVIRGILDVLAKEWDLPFVTAFYSYITNGSQLSVINLLSLMIAIPATVLYKIVKNKAPFPDEKSVNTFKSSFDSRKMLSSFKQSFAGSAVTNEAALLGNGFLDFWKGMLAWCTAYAEGFGWVLSGIGDMAPPNIAYPGEESMNKVTLGFEFAASIFSFPWFASAAAPEWQFKQPYNPEGAAHAAWLYNTIVVVGIDAIIYGCSKRLPENWNDWGVALSLILSLGSLAFGGIACLGASDFDRTVQILPVVPNLIKLGRLTPIVGATDGVSLVVVGLSDILFGSISSLLTGVQGLLEESPTTA